MGKTTLIEWTETTWNPWQGCRKISTGCLNCYMYRAKRRYGQDPTIISKSRDTTFFAPAKWKDSRFIFTCSWSDWFIEEADEWRNEGWDIIRKNQRHVFQILTKRPERIINHLPNDWGKGWDNVWLGVTIENQDYVNRLLLLQQVPSSFRFISAEPLIGEINFPTLTGINWIIVGGESGPGNRKMDLNWARIIRDRCISDKIPFFFKQIGGTKKIDGAWGGKHLDGRVWTEKPDRGTELVSEFA